MTLKEKIRYGNIERGTCKWHYVKLALEEGMDLSQDRLRGEWIN